jgi:hypothetical protein
MLLLGKSLRLLQETVLKKSPEWYKMKSNPPNRFSFKKLGFWGYATAFYTNVSGG